MRCDIKSEFIVDYDLHYAPINNPAPDMSIPWSGLNSRFKHLYSSRDRAVILCEVLAHDKTNSVIKPAVPEGQVTDPIREACRAGILYEGNIVELWKVNAGRFPILAPMARDILPVQGGSVVVERVFSMARHVIPYQNSRLKISTFRSSMLMKSYENEELQRVLAGNDSV